MYSKNQSICILIAAHKKFRVPEDSIYLPIHVGREGKKDLGFQGDNTGENISKENNVWGELTGLYWGWKNLNVDYIGLVHYRRYFMYKKKRNLFSSILNEDELKNLLKRSDIILPVKRNYRIATLEEHFNGYDFSLNTDLPNLKAAICEVSPEYVEAFENVMKRKSGHMCNMFIMKKELMDEFCEWEFKVLKLFEKKIENNERNRIVAYMAEHMLDIWIEKNKYHYIECGVALLDRKNEFDRRFDFLMRKLGLKMRRIKL